MKLMYSPAKHCNSVSQSREFVMPTSTQQSSNSCRYEHLNDPISGYQRGFLLRLIRSIGTPSAAHLLGNLSTLYSPELVIGTTPACCSDHQSFLSFGFPATAVFERNGMIADPMYHNTGDVSSREGYDFGQVVSIAKVTMAGVMSVAGWRVGEMV